MTMSAFSRSRFSKYLFCLASVAICFALPLGAQTGTAPAAKPKVKLGPRPLPGTGSSGSQAAAPEAPDIAAAEAEARARVPLFRPASVKGPAATRVETLSAGANSNQNSPQVQQGSERARIVVIRRRGTFEIPKTPSHEAPVIVNDLSEQRVTPTEAVPVALPPGKIRVIPRDSVKIGTPPQP